jgi:hypothetical protein
VFGVPLFRYPPEILLNDDEVVKPEDTKGNKDERLKIKDDSFPPQHQPQEKKDDDEKKQSVSQYGGRIEKGGLRFGKNKSIGEKTIPFEYRENIECRGYGQKRKNKRKDKADFFGKHEVEAKGPKKKQSEGLEQGIAYKRIRTGVVFNKRKFVNRRFDEGSGDNKTREQKKNQKGAQKIPVFPAGKGTVIQCIKGLFYEFLPFHYQGCQEKRDAEAGQQQPFYGMSSAEKDEVYVEGKQDRNKDTVQYPGRILYPLKNVFHQ